ncbi:hydroxyacid dehydrogenase [Robertmurraya massiliosenegalensis]|uniref:hydroxyacid dehydrogenase n=1 Tax=Robertmurraya massiliosenegalensis TaxID=1287657 RepID=UPI000309B1DE|nr:hydroxyacid dehydrogenase [Robertmurraya massiliosenegalensis]
MKKNQSDGKNLGKVGKPTILQVLPMYHHDGEQYLQEYAHVIQTNDYRVEHLCTLVKRVDAIVLRAPAQITKEVLDANPYLKVISGAGVGLDNIDVNYATLKGIPVVHAPRVNKVSTAEHAVMFILALSKSVISFHEEMKKGNYHARNLLTALELRGKSVGLIGFGGISQEVAKRIIPFGVNVKAWVRVYNEEKQRMAKELQVELTTNIEEIFSESDFVSLHIPLNDETRGLVSKSLLSLMKPSAYLVNTARGAVVNQQYLYELLKEGKIAGAALDVFDPEPPPKDLSLLRLPNIIVTPHVGGTTVECNQISATAIAENVINILNGEEPMYLANPQYKETLFSKKLKGDE